MAEVLDIVVRQRGARQVSKDIAAIGVSANSAASSLKKFQITLRSTANGFTQATSASQKFTAQCQKSTRCTQMASAAMAKTKTSLTGVGVGAAVAGAALTAGFLRPLIAATSAAADFQTAMNLTGVLSNVDRASIKFKELEATALELGKTTQFTAVQAAEGMQFLALAGLRADETLQAIPDTLNLAAAASIDLGRAADITTNILKGFGLELEQLPQAVDILASTFTNSNVNIEQLSASFRKVGPIASQMGQTFGDTAAILGTLGNAGIQAEEAGTALRRLFLNLDVDAGKSNSILKKFGINVRDVNGEFRPLIDIFKDISKVSIEPAQRIKLFGARALAAANVIENAVEGLDDFSASLENDVGRAAAVAAARLEGFNGAVKIMKSALEGLAIAIANSGLLGFLTKAVKGLTVFIRFMANLPGPVLAVITAVAGLAGALGALLIPVGLIAIGISTLAPLLAGLTFAGVTASMGAFLAVAAPIVAVVTALVVGWKAIKDVQFDVGNSTLSLGNIMEETFSTIGGLLDDAVLGFKLLAEGSGSTTNALAEDSNQITDNLPSFQEFAASGIASFEIFGRVVAAVFVRVGKGIAGFASDSLDAVFAIPEALKAAFDGDESTTAGSILASKFRNGFIQQFEGFGDEVKGIVEDATAKANSALSLLGESDFIKRAAARGGEAGEVTGGGGGDGDDAGDGGDDAATAATGRFTEAQIAAKVAVDALTAARIPGFAAIESMVKATNALNNAQQLGVISGERNLAILREVQQAGGEEFLASINPVTAAYRDRKMALEELAIVSELFNLTEQQTLIAGEAIIEQSNQRLLQLDQFKEKLTLIEAATLGVSEGAKNFSKSLGTSFDIVAGGVQQLGNLIKDTLVTALKEGTISFKEFASSVIGLIQDIVIELLIQIALQAILKALGGGGTGAADGASITAAANGATGKVGETFLVGEEGPELFVPKSSGDIVPNKQSAAMMNQTQAPAPEVNVQVVNVSSADEVPDAMASPGGEKVIMNTVLRNKNQLKEIL